MEIRMYEIGKRAHGLPGRESGGTKSSGCENAWIALCAGVQDACLLEICCALCVREGLIFVVRYGCGIMRRGGCCASNV